MIDTSDSPAEARPAGFRFSEQINELASALAAAQAEMDLATKNAKNPFFGSRYADLGEVMKACRPALSKHGIAILQGPFTSGPEVTIVTRLMHSSGQWVECSISSTAMEQLSREEKRDGVAAKPTTNPQALGSVITYLRRYALSAIAGVATEDDDAEAAYDRRQEPERGGKKPNGAPRLDAKDLEAISTAFGKFGISMTQLEEKMGRKQKDWTDGERAKLMKIYKGLEQGEAAEEIFGADIQDPKAKAEPGASG